MLGPYLIGERVTLGPVLPEHLPLYRDWLADTRVTAYLHNDYAYSLRQEEEWLERSSHSEADVVWAMHANGQLVGMTGLHRIDWKNRHAWSGMVIGDRTAWGKGLATEAMRLRTRYAFESLGMEKVLTEVWTENVASRRALEKAGYTQAGLFRRQNFRHGRWHDVWIGEVLREEWEQRDQDVPNWRSPASPSPGTM